MSARSDEPAAQKSSLLTRLTGRGKHATHDSEGAAGDDKVVYYSSNLFSASMMVDATRRDRDEPVPEEDDEAQR